MEKISFDNIAQQETVFSPKDVFKNVSIDVSEVIERQPIALAKGYYNYKGFEYPRPLVSLGNFMCIVGASKSMKSVLKSVLVSACWDSQYLSNNFKDLQNYNLKDKIIADFDTEQGKYHAQKVFRRSTEMVGTVPDNYLPFALRSLTPKERLQFIEWFHFESEYRDNIGLVSIDGVADLVDNVNDLESSNKVVNSLMKMTADTNSAMITVLHKNFGTSKPTGHLGSAVLKKAETVIGIERSEKGLIIEAKADYTRNIPFDDFMFCLDDNTFLPYESTDDF